MKKFLFSCLCLTTITIQAADKTACVEARRSSDPNTLEICQTILEIPDTSLNDQSIIYITQAEYLISNSRYDAANQILDLAFNANPEMLKNGYYRLNWLRIKGSLFVTKEEFVQSLPFFEQALEVAQIMNNEALIANGYNDLGSVNLEMGNYLEALKWLKQSLVIHQKREDSFRTGLSLANIGDVYQLLSNHEEALAYYQFSLEAHEKNLSQTPEEKAYLEPYIAQVHQDMGDSLMAVNNIDAAVHHFNKALNVYQTYELVAQQVSVLSHLGHLHLQNQKIHEALNILQQALKLEATLENSNHIKLQEYWVQALIMDHQWSAAETAAKLGLKIAKNKNSSSSEIILLQLSSQIAEQQNNHEKALSFYKQQQRLEANRLEQKFNQALIGHQAEIEVIQKQKEITQLKNLKTKQELKLTQQRWLFTLIGLALLMFIAYLSYLLKRKNQKRVSVLNDRASHSEQLEQLNMVNTIDDMTLFKHINTPLICFNTTGKIIYQSHKSNGFNQATQIQVIYPDVWKMVLEHLNEDEKLGQDLFFESAPTNPAAFENAWLHQLTALDDLIIGLFFDKNGNNKQALADADKIKKYSQFKALLSETWHTCQQLPIHKIDQYNPILNAMKNSQITSIQTEYSNHELKSLAVDLMTACLESWQSSTGKDIIDFAEQSGLWLISIDEGRIRTRTLNRYLDIQKIPKNPRWHQVTKTAHFVLSYCDLKFDERQALNHKTQHFKESIRNRLLS